MDLYTQPPAYPSVMVLCVDEMGPVSAKSYPGRQLVRRDPPCQRAKQATDYGLRGSGYVYGALWPAQGAVYTQTYEHRRAAQYVDFLAEVDAWVDPAVERVVVIVDNLRMHRSIELQLFSLLHPRWEFLFQPKAAAYLNLIEPWWKVLRSLGLKGQRFETWEQVGAAVRIATAYWNGHKHPFVWGRRRRHRCCSHRQYGVALPANVA